MPRTIQKSPRDPWPDAERGLSVTLLPGIHQAVQLSGEPDMTIQGTDGAIIEGSIRPSGGEPACSIRVMDGADRLAILGPLEVRGSDGRGIRVTAAEDITLEGLWVHDCAIECVITGDCLRGDYSNLRLEDSRNTPAPGYSRDKMHALYCSGNCDESQIAGIECRNVTGSGLQINGGGMNAVASGVIASELVFEHCGIDNTPPISLMACRGCTIEKFNIDWTAGDRWAVLFDDYKGEQFACYNNTLRTYTVPRGTHPAEEGGSAHNTFSEGMGWSPEPEPPEPEPEPPPDDGIDREAVLAALDALDGALAIAGAQVAAATEQSATIRELVSVS